MQKLKKIQQQINKFTLPKIKIKFIPSYMFILAMLVFSSCRINKKLLSEIDNANSKLLIVTNELNKKIEQQHEDGNIEDAIKIKFEEKVAVLRLNALKRDSVLKITKKYNRNFFTGVTHAGKLRKIERIFSGYGTQINDEVALQTIITSSININSFYKFKSASFFPPGEYKISSEIIPLAKEVFSPIVDSIIKFTNLYSNTKLLAQIATYGYADGTGIAEDSPLFNEMKILIRDKPLTKENINSHLSYLRAIEVGKIISELIEEKKDKFTNFEKLKIEIINEGKGEEMPEKNRSYNISDERRRIVKLFWKVLPE